MSASPEPNSQNIISSPKEPDSELFVVGIGTSVVGLSALEELFSHLSTASGAAFVVIQHLSPDFKSLMKELLERRTSMPVHRVKEGMELEPNSVYLIPPGQNLALEKNVLRLEDRKKDKKKKHELNFPIDLFLISLAKNYGEHSIGVILSGSGSDGTRGLKAINDAGGVALVQDPATAEFNGMPRSAIATGVINQILPPRELAKLIYQCIVSVTDASATQLERPNLISNTDLSKISRLLLEEEGLDFSQYKSSTISRRIHRRCLIHNSKSFDQYLDLLNNSTEERQILCSDLLINVTHFFRDYPAWQNLENNILPRLIEHSEHETELRFWITACSTGEEAYSLAILVHEALQDSDKNIRVKIFATDINRAALEKASQGIYPPSIARDIGSERLQRYFVAKDNSYQIMRKIREMLIFSPHDLTKDAGFTRINLITCRNVLIYMKSDLQDRVLRNLHFSLISKGILFLGEAETLGEFESEFEPIDKKWKFFQKRRDIRLPLNLKSTPKISKNFLHRFSQPQNKINFEPILEQCLNRLSAESHSIMLLVSQDNHLLHVSGDSSKIFKAPDGKVTTEVDQMVVLPLRLPLNTALHRAKQKGNPVQYQGIKLEYQGEPLNLSLEVIPPYANRRYGDFFLVKIKPEVTAAASEISQTETFELGSKASRRIIELENELQQTRENLQALVEELETTNKEQQASNEELHTVNIEYQSKIGELAQLNNDIDNLLKSTEIGVIFLDSQLRIRKFTPAATQAISLRGTDIERPLAELTMKVDCPQLPELLEEVLAHHQSIELEVKQQKSDSWFLMQINPYLTEDGQNQDISDRLKAETKLRRQKTQLSKLNRNLEEKVAQRTKVLATFSDRLKQLHHLAISDYDTLEELYTAYLKTGCEIFGLSTGIVSQVTEDIYKVLAVKSSLAISVGLEMSCGDTYCSEVVEKRKTVAYFDVRQLPGMQNHLAYLRFDLKSFIGTPILVNGRLYGTLNFSSVFPRSADFNSSEQEIIELMARDIGNSISAFQSEIALKQSEAEFRKTFEQAKVGITHVALNGRFLKVNSALCDFLGYDSQDLLAMKFQDITYPEDLALDEKYVPQVIAEEIESCTYEKRYIHADGSIIWANLTFCLVKAEGKEFSYFIAIVEDICDRKQGEISLQQASQAKDRFIAHMSHELRTPLNSVIGFSNILKQDPDLTARQLKSIDIINQSGQHLLTLINDVLDLSKLNANKLELLHSDLNLINFLHDITSLFQIRAPEKGLEFVTQISPDLPAVVSADETRLRQVLLNLLSNAIKFTSTGSVKLAVDCSTPIENIKKIRFQVEDTGRGIATNECGIVFAPFGQINQNAEGTGLGIPICQNILELMNSELHLESKLGQGSIFWFELELEVISSSPTIGFAESTTSQWLVLSQPIKVLVVDDNEDNRILLVEYLRPLGFTVQEADNGQTGLAIAQDFNPDVILLDLLMPIMDGREMSDRIRQHPQLKDTLVLVISANTKLIIDSSDLKCDGFLAKPVDFTKLLQLLAQHLELDWQPLPPKSDSNSSLILPELDELNQLLELANSGNMDGLLEQINLLAAADSRYNDFAQKVRQLADSCQQAKLEKLFKASMK